jgi:hypothetical protein
MIQAHIDERQLVIGIGIGDNASIERLNHLRITIYFNDNGS